MKTYNILTVTKYNGNIIKLDINECNKKFDIGISYVNSEITSYIRNLSLNNLIAIVAEIQNVIGQYTDENS